MNESANLSIVIPAYKSVHLEKVLGALSGFSCLEIIVIDSSPCESSLKLEPHIKYHWSPKRFNPGEARNLGAELSQGKWILFLDSDVLLGDEAKFFLSSKNVNKLESNVLYWGIYRTYGNERIWTEVQNVILAFRFNQLFRQSKKLVFGQASHLLISKKWFEEIGGFNPNLRMREDAELAVRSSILGGQQKVFPEFVATHLKEFCFIGLWKDYFFRSFHCILAQKKFSTLFRKLDILVSKEILFLWYFPFFILFLMRILPANAPLIILGGFLIQLLSADHLLKTCKSKRRFRLFMAFAVAGPVMGAGAALGYATAILIHTFKTIMSLFRSLLDYGHLFIKILIRYGSPIHITHFLTNKCNMRCDHCFYIDTLNTAPKEMNMNRVVDLYSATGPLLWLAVGGGEPFLRKDLVNILGAAITRSRPKILTIPTNGVMSESIFFQTLRFLQRYPCQKLAIQFSIDGDQSVHDKIRGAGSWFKTQMTVHKMKKLQKLFPNLNLSIITVVSENNHHLFPKLIDHLSREFLLDQIHINLYRYGYSPSPKIPYQVIEKYKESTDYNFERISQSASLGYEKFLHFVVTRVGKIQKDIIYQVATHGKFLVPCEGGTLSYTVWEDEHIGPCEILKERFAFNDFKKFWRLTAFRILRKKIKAEKCRCTYECAMTINSLKKFR